jgi:hypothetical protein
MIFILVLIAAPILILTYRVKNRIALWSLIIVPPLFLSALFVLPIRGPQSMGVGLPLLIFLPISVVVLLVRIVQLVRNKSDKMVRMKFVRPVLTVVMFIIVSNHYRALANQANSYAIGLAAQLQRQCDADGLCVLSIPGWQSETTLLTHEPYCSSGVRLSGIYYPMHYAASADKKSFTLTLVHGFNMEPSVEGGVGKSLKAVYYDEGGMKEIPVAGVSNRSSPSTFSIYTNALLSSTNFGK